MRTTLTLDPDVAMSIKKRMAEKKLTLKETGAKTRIEEIEGFGDTSVRNLFNAIEARREIPLERFIYALGIRHVGETTAVAVYSKRQCPEPYFEPYEICVPAPASPQIAAAIGVVKQAHRALGVDSLATHAELRRYAPRDLWALAAALAGPVAASGVLLPFRASWSNTNVALLLVVVVVAVAAAGNRTAGALAAVALVLF